MNFFQRVNRIIKSNLHYEENDANFDNFSGSTFENSDFQESEFEDLNFSNSKKTSANNSLEAEYYANLELPYGASFSQIKIAYKKLLKKYHPDKFYGNDKKTQIAQNVIKKLNIAYEYFDKKFN